MNPPDLLASWPLLVVSTVFLGAGLVTWFGGNRRLVLRAWPSPTTHLAPLYMGLAGVLTALSPFMPGWLATVLLPLAMLLFAVGVIAVVWLPGFLKPRWLRRATPWRDPLRRARPRSASSPQTGVSRAVDDLIPPPPDTDDDKRSV